jgi:hypothetical protein
VEPDLVLDPEQPDEVAAAVEKLVAERPRPVDPWWRAGVREALEGAPDP